MASKSVELARPEASRALVHKGQGRSFFGRHARILFIILKWWLLRRPVDFLFLVYGTESDRRKMLPGFLGPRVGDRVFPGGVISMGTHRGYIAVTFKDHNLIRDDPKIALDILERTKRVFRLSPKGTVALAGQLPGFVLRQSKIEAPFVVGNRGTRYAMVRSTELLANTEFRGIAREELTVAVLGGAGFTGGSVVRDLAQVFGAVIAFDTRHGEGVPPSRSTGDMPRNVECRSNPEALRKADIVLNFLPKGDDVQSLVPYFRNGAVFGDDTHPMMSRKVRAELRSKGIYFWKLVMERPETPLEYDPLLPGFSRGNIPGCLVEAIVTLETGRRFDVDSHATSYSLKEFEAQAVFSDIADQLGFRARLVDPDQEMIG